MLGALQIGFCLGIIGLYIPASHQQSPSALFLVTVPEEIYAGKSTLIAVTVLADFNVQVTAEVGQSKDTALFTKDMTALLTLPPIYSSNGKTSSVSLTVRGFKDDQVIYANTTTIAFNLRNVSRFIQTDRQRYQPGDTVRVRVASVYPDNTPYRGKVELSLTNPDGNVVDVSQASENNGIMLGTFTLSQGAPLGLWTVSTTTNGLIDSLAFVVDYFERPPFEVLINIPSHVLIHEDIMGSVRALYSSGQPVQGTVVVTLMLELAEGADMAFTLTQTKEIYGSTQFHFSEADLEPLDAMVQREVTVHVHAAVTGNSTVNRGIKVTKQIQIQVHKEIYQLTLKDYSHQLMPGMHFFAKLIVSRFDLEPLTAEELRDVAFIEIIQRNSTHVSDLTSLTHPVPADGIVLVGFRLQAGVEALLIHARFMSSMVTLDISKSLHSPTGSFIQIAPISSTQIGSSVLVSVKSSVQPELLHYVVRSMGQVVTAGTKEFGSFSLTPSRAWFPQACVTVYCVLADGEIMSDSAHMAVKQEQVSLSWSSGKAQPGELVTLSLTGPESGSEVGIVIMGTDDSAPEISQEAEVEQKCFVWMQTNGKHYETQRPEASNQDIIMKHWRKFMDGTETLLWLDATMGDTTWRSEKIKVPDGVNSLRAAAFVMSPQHGLSFTSQKLSVSKDFSLSLNVPPYLIRGEEIVLEVNIINHLNRDLEVILLLAESDTFEFVMAQRGSMSVVNAQKLILRSHISAKALFPVRLVALGEVDISVDAVSAEASESLVWTVLVKPEGVEESVSENLFLEIPPTMNNFSISAAFSFPAGVISDTRQAHLAIGGDILALSIHNLDSLVDLPLVNGEQNMMQLAPSIYVLKYLRWSQDDASISSKVMRQLEEGYQRQLSYQRSDGSFSAFGASDSSGSTWLTAYVVKCFHQAQNLIKVDEGVLTKARDWLLSQQGPEGQFTEAGTTMHTEMKEEPNGDPVALTAYVLIALLEHPTTADRYADKISVSKSYLEERVMQEISNYSLSLAACALALTSGNEVVTALNKLNSRADIKDGVGLWTSSAGALSQDQPHSVQIEIAAYILLAYSYRGDIVEAISLMKWLTMQRNHLGGFGSTQATVAALEAMAHFAVFSGAFAIDLRLKITSPTTLFKSVYQINSTNYRALQGQELTYIDVNEDLNLDIYMEGRGFAAFQINVFYSLDSKTFSENLQHIMTEEPFLLNVELYAQEDDFTRLQMSVCMRLKDSEAISKTGIAILDVGILSGFAISPNIYAPTDLIPKIDTFSDKVVLFLRSINTTEVCVTLPFVRIYKVAHIQDAVVRVYDYYEPMRRATRMYNLDDLRTLDPCVFCGEDCELCLPGVSIVVPGVTSRSVISTTYSLSCLLTNALYMTFTFSLVSNLLI